MESFYVLCIACCVLVRGVFGDFANNEIPEFERESPSQQNSVLVDINNNFVVREPSPCQMINSPFGCCWNKKSIPTGPNGQGCPVCEDRKKRHCKNWADSCTDATVRNVCPRTCGLCDWKPKIPNCQDDHKWTTQCELYKNLDLCYLDSIQKNCRKTCNKCYV